MKIQENLGTPLKFLARAKGHKELCYAQEYILNSVSLLACNCKNVKGTLKLSKSLIVFLVPFTYFYNSRQTARLYSILIYIPERNIILYAPWLLREILRVSPNYPNLFSLNFSINPSLSTPHTRQRTFKSRKCTSSTFSIW